MNVHFRTTKDGEHELKIVGGKVFWGFVYTAILTLLGLQSNRMTDWLTN